MSRLKQSCFFFADIWLGYTSSERQRSIPRALESENSNRRSPDRETRAARKIGGVLRISWRCLQTFKEIRSGRGGETRRPLWHTSYRSANWSWVHRYVMWNRWRGKWVGFVEFSGARSRVPLSCTTPGAPASNLSIGNRWVNLNPARCRYRCLGKQWVTDGQSCKWDGCLLSRACSTFTENLTRRCRAGIEERVSPSAKPSRLAVSCLAELIAVRPKSILKTLESREEVLYGDEQAFFTMSQLRV